MLDKETKAVIKSTTMDLLKCSYKKLWLALSRIICCDYSFLAVKALALLETNLSLSYLFMTVQNMQAYEYQFILIKAIENSFLRWKYFY